MGKMLTNYDNLKSKEDDNYQKSMKKLCYILIAGTIFYYLLPLLAVIAFQTKSESIYIYMFIGIFPFYAFISCFLHGKSFGFNMLVPCFVGIMFVPTVIIFQYDFRYIVLSIVYIVLGIFGQFTGYLMKKRKKLRKAPIGAKYAANRYAKKRK